MAVSDLLGNPIQPGALVQYRAPALGDPLGIVRRVFRDNHGMTRVAVAVVVRHGGGTRMTGREGDWPTSRVVVTR